MMLQRNLRARGSTPEVGSSCNTEGDPSGRMEAVEEEVVEEEKGEEEEEEGRTRKLATD